jgi:hypothetical protein
VVQLLLTVCSNLGKYINHKGKNRRFTNPEEIEEQMKREEKERKWRVRKSNSMVLVFELPLWCLNHAVIFSIFIFLGRAG